MAFPSRHIRIMDRLVIRLPNRGGATATQIARIRELRCSVGFSEEGKTSMPLDGRRRMGRVGYSPSASKNWKAINRSRPEDRKKIDRQTRIFLPLTDAVIEKHLLGKETAGIYPLLPDETCWFLAVDFDKKTWQKDASGVPGSLPPVASAGSFGAFSVR